jgi:hypothetical protein
MEHGKDHDNRNFHNLNRTTRRKHDRANDPEDDTILEDAPASKITKETPGQGHA